MNYSIRIGSGLRFKWDNHTILVIHVCAYSEKQK